MITKSGQDPVIWRDPTQGRLEHHRIDFSIGETHSLKQGARAIFRFNSTEKSVAAGDQRRHRQSIREHRVAVATEPCELPPFGVRSSGPRRPARSHADHSSHTDRIRPLVIRAVGLSDAAGAVTISRLRGKRSGPLVGCRSSARHTASWFRVPQLSG